MGPVIDIMKAVREKLAVYLKPVDPSEMQQARIRLFICACLTPYFLWYRFGNHGHISTGIFVLLVLFCAYSFFVVASLHFDFLGTRLRRDVNFLIDTVFICYTMKVGDRVVAPLVLTLYWQTIGYTMRYGARYMKYGIVLSGLGFFLVINSTPYWIANWELGYGLLFGATVIPAFLLGNMVKKIRGAQQKAEDANATKSRFLSSMSHELRTPLSGVLGAVDLFTGTEVSDEQKGFLSIIHASGTHLLSLVNDVLDISKIEEGKVSISPEKMDLHDFVKNAVTIVSQQAIRKGLAFRVSMSPSIPYSVKGDAMRLRQILANLLSNAIKFTSTGEIVVRILLESEDATHIYVRFEVSDTGIGIAQEQQGVIFDRFVQADNTIVRKYGGTGLGTAISKELVSLMGGKIGLRSSPGTGSTFWFCVPLEKVPINIECEVRANTYRHLRAIVVSGNDPSTGKIYRYLSKMGITRIEHARDTAQARILIERISNPRATHHFVLVVKENLGDDSMRFSDQLSAENLRKNARMVLVGDHSLEDASRHGYRSLVESLDSFDEFRRAIHFVKPGEGYREEVVKEAAKNHPLRILVAEDNEVNQIVIQKLLERAGHRVRMVSNGKMALGAMIAERFDVALLDLNMPVMSGLDTAINYLARGVENPTPMIALTADAMVETRKKCEAAGMQGYLTKPFEIRKVFETLHAITPAVPDTSETRAEASPDAVDESGMISDSVIQKLEKMGSSKIFIQNLVWVFVRDTEKHTRTMEDSLMEGDIESFARSAHALKGIAGSMGVLKIMDLAEEAQNLGDDTTLEKREGILAEIKKEMVRVRKSLMRQYSVSEPGKDHKTSGAPSDRLPAPETSANKVHR
jgi:two-component system sensor histidine kinase RpfC